MLGIAGNARRWLLGKGAGGKTRTKYEKDVFPGEKKRHLFRRSDGEVREVRNRLENIGAGLQDCQTKKGGEHTETRAGLAGVYLGQRSLDPDRPEWWLSSAC